MHLVTIEQSNSAILRQKAKPISFPLTTELTQMIEQMLDCEMEGFLAGKEVSSKLKEK